jgi:hypothetical protein
MQVEVGRRVGGRDDDRIRRGEVVSDVRKEDVCARCFHGRARPLRPRRAHCVLLASVPDLPSSPANEAGKMGMTCCGLSAVTVGDRAPSSSRDCRFRTSCRRRARKTRAAAKKRALRFVISVRAGTARRCAGRTRTGRRGRERWSRRSWSRWGDMERRAQLEMGYAIRER